MNSQNNTAKHPPDQTKYLPAIGTWSSAWYLLDGRSQDAIDLAVASGRPLLVRGLPGTGKSDLARAAAEYLSRAFVYEVVTARTEPQDLLWRFDAISRLADAQAQGQSGAVRGSQGQSGADPGNPLHYVSPGSLWWALDWNSADIHLRELCKTPALSADEYLKANNGDDVEQAQRAQQTGSVLLLDEIDKADSELPNSLLEVLANTGFKLPWGNIQIKADVGNRPLIIITTNEDRELPPAFVRRCRVLNIAADSDFEGWIKQRARVHFRESDDQRDQRPVLSQQVLNEAAQQLMEDRSAMTGDYTKPGLAEYLDLLRGLQNLAPDDEQKQLDWLKRVAQFAYHKQPRL